MAGERQSDVRPEYPFDHRGIRVEPEPWVFPSLIYRGDAVEVPVPQEPLTEASVRFISPIRHRRRRPPRWMVELQAQDASHEEILAELLRRVRANPTEPRLLNDALTIINEFGRVPAAQPMIRNLLTQALIDELTDVRAE